MRCKACNAPMYDAVSQEMIDAGLCRPCYHTSNEAITDYEYGLTENVRPPAEYALRWEGRYVKDIRHDSDE